MSELDDIQREMNETTGNIEELAEELAQIGDARGYDCLVYLSSPILEDSTKVTTYAAISTNGDETIKFNVVKNVINLIQNKAILFELKAHIESKI